MVREYFLIKSELNFEELWDEFLRLKEIFNVSIRIRCLSDKRFFNNHTYFISLENFNKLDEKQTSELHRIQKCICMLPLAIWFKKEFLDKLKIKKAKNHPNSTFYKIGKEIYFEFKNVNLYCKYENFWNIFLNSFGMHHQETSNFFKQHAGKFLELKIIDSSETKFTNKFEKLKTWNVPYLESYFI
jgi:hypothetical protein